LPAVGKSGHLVTALDQVRQVGQGRDRRYHRSIQRHVQLASALCSFVQR
jgi:hypothetical protein